MTTYYVDSEAPGGGDGSELTPWNDVEDVENGATDNDTVYFKRGGTYSLSLGSFTLPGHTMVISAYGTGDKPIFDNMVELSGSSSVGSGVYSYAINYQPIIVIYNGLVLQLNDDGTTSISEGQWDWNGSDTLYVNIDGTTDPDDGHLKIPRNQNAIVTGQNNNCTITYIHILGSGGTKAGILSFNSDSTTVNNITVQYAYTGVQSSHAAGDVSTLCNISDSNFSDCKSGATFIRSTYGIVESNIITQINSYHDNFSRGTAAYSVLFSDGSDNCTAKNNYVDTLFGEGIKSNSSDNVSMIFNYIKYVKGGILYEDDSDNGTVYHNTVYKTVSPDNGHAHYNPNVVGYADNCITVKDTCNNLTVKNNISYEDHDSTYTQSPLANGGTEEDHVINYNDLYVEGNGSDPDVVNWGPAGGSANMTFTEWQAYNSQQYGQNSVSVDPNILASGKLKVTSPCIDIGVVIPGINDGGELDIWGNVTGSTPNIGAYQGPGEGIASNILGLQCKKLGINNRQVLGLGCGF